MKKLLLLVSFYLLSLATFNFSMSFASEAPIWKFLDIDKTNVVVFLEYFSSNTSFSKEIPENDKGVKYRPDANFQYSASESGKVTLHVQRIIPDSVKDSRCREFVYLLRDGNLALKRKDVSKLYFDSYKYNMEEPIFWKYLTHMPIYENHLFWPSISDFVQNPNLIDSVRISEIHADKNIITFRTKKSKDDNGEYSGTFSIELEKIGNDFYPINISCNKIYFSKDGQEHSGPNVVNIKYGEYVKLNNLDLYIPKKIESKRFDVTVNASYEFKQELRYAETVEVTTISESNNKAMLWHLYMPTENFSL